MRRFAYILILLLAVVPASFADNKKIIKWVDNDGVTHYDDKPPMPESAKKASVLNKEGIEVKKISQEPSDYQTEQAAAQLNRRDAALLASYNSAEEIDIAKERNTRIDLIALENMQVQLQVYKSTHLTQQKMMGEFIKRKETIPPALLADAKKTQAEISSTEKNISIKKEEIAAIQKRYDADKQRFIELKPRDFNLVDLKSKRQHLTELEAWRVEAEKRVEHYRAESLRHKRANETAPKNITDGLLSASKELARAEEEINTLKQQIRQNEAKFSQGK